MIIPQLYVAIMYNKQRKIFLFYLPTKHYKINNLESLWCRAVWNNLEMLNKFLESVNIQILNIIMRIPKA